MDNSFFILIIVIAILSIIFIWQMYKQSKYLNYLEIKQNCLLEIYKNHDERVKLITELLHDDLKLATDEFIEKSFSSEVKIISDYFHGLVDEEEFIKEMIEYKRSIDCEEDNN